MTQYMPISGIFTITGTLSLYFTVERQIDGISCATEGSLQCFEAYPQDIVVIAKKK